MISLISPWCNGESTIYQSLGKRTGAVSLKKEAIRVWAENASAMKNLLWPLMVCLTAITLAQSGVLEDLLQSAKLNKQILAQYSWRETQTLSLDGEIKSTTVSQVVIGADGKPQKSVISQTKAPPKEVRGPLRKKIVHNKTDEFKDYAQSVVSLARQYSHPDPAKLQEAFKKGNFKVDPSPGDGLSQFTISSYLKENDSLTIVIDAKKKAMQSVLVNSYLEKPSDKVTIRSGFSPFPTGGSHLDQTTIIGEKKKLELKIANSNYQKRS